MGNKEFYRLAHAYDIAFSDRDYNAECDYLEWIFNHHAKVKSNGKKNIFFELACGPANHAREFVKRGWDSYALDVSEAMIAYAKLKDEKEKALCNYITSDMINFKLDTKVHFAINPLESISHIVTNESMIKHLRSVGKALYKGGIYLIEATHPRFVLPDEEANVWTLREKETKVEILFGLPEDEYDAVSQQWSVTTGFKIWENGKLKDESMSKGLHRFYFVQEMKLLIELSGCFDKYWFYGNSVIPPRELDNSDESEAFIIILRKK